MVKGENGSIGPAASLEPGVLSPSEAAHDIGTYQTVQFHVSRTYTDSSGTEFLDQFRNYSKGFVVTIFARYLGDFGVDPAATYLDSTIRVSGYLENYDGYLEILNPLNILQVNGPN